jgi:fumarate hydratase class II
MLVTALNTKIGYYKGLKLHNGAQKRHNIAKKKVRLDMLAPKIW